MAKLYLYLLLVLLLYSLTLAQNGVATLVNDHKENCVCEVYFNAANLSSGIYYYQLKAGSLLETKKMTLIK